MSKLRLEAANGDCSGSEKLRTKYLDPIRKKHTGKDIEDAVNLLESIASA